MAKANRYAGSLPDTYHQYLVPLIFAEYAEDLAQRVTVSAGNAVLETAAGTGVLTERLAEVLPDDMTIVATDLNPAMLAVAEKNLANFANVSCEVANGIDLPFEDDSFDTVVCQFGIMFFPDIDQAYREARRVLKAGGDLIFNVWDTLEQNSFSRAVHEAAMALDANDPPDFLRLPYAYHDVDAISGQLGEAGFDEIIAEYVPSMSQAPSAHDVAIALAAGSPLAEQLQERNLQDTAVDAITAELEREFGSGEVTAPMQAIVFHAL
jgi:ubiquinone/menaquinone biosynthesis C-methylase UbiE